MSSGDTMIVAIAGGKGGVGKTTVSLNLGREMDAVVVDGDLAMPDLPRGRGPDLHDVLADRAEPMDAVEEVCSVALLPCGRTLAGARAAEMEGLGRTLDHLDRQFEHVLVDCPAGLARNVGHQLLSSDGTVLVTRPNRAAVKAALRTSQLARKVETPVIGVALNRVRGDEDRAVADRIEGELNASAITIERSAKIEEAQEWGEPVRDVFPEAPSVEDFAELAGHIESCDDGAGGPRKNA